MSGIVCGAESESSSAALFASRLSRRLGSRLVAREAVAHRRGGAFGGARGRALAIAGVAARAEAELVVVEAERKGVLRGANSGGTDDASRGCGAMSRRRGPAGDARAGSR